VQATILNKVANGLPGTLVVDDLSDRMTYLEYTHAALWGPLTATIRFSGDIMDGFTYADQYLGNPVAIYSPDGRLQWEGTIWKVTFGTGRRKRVRSMDGYANFVWTEYTTVDANGVDQGPGGLSFLSDADQIAIYGQIDAVVSGGSLQAINADPFTLAQLNSKKRLLWNPDTGNATLGLATTQQPQIELVCYGYYHTLWNRQYELFTFPGTGALDTSVMITTALNTTAPFISTDYSQIQTTGVTIPQYQPTQRQNLGEWIKQWLAMSDGWIFGVDFGRIPYLRPSNRFNTTIDYVERVDGLIETPQGQEIRLWDVRPDTIMRQQDFVPQSVNLASAIDSLENIYLAQTTFQTPYQLIYQASVAGPDAHVQPV
jgi:hypothetical protein